MMVMDMYIDMDMDMDIVNKVDELHATVHIFDTDIIRICESWLTPDIVNSEIQLPGYDLFRNDRINGKSGGVLLYVKSSLKPSEFQTVSPFKNQVWCRISDLAVGVCYRTMNMEIAGSENNDHLLDLIDEIGTKHVLLMGDLNCPDIDWSQHSVTATADKDTKSFLKSIDDVFLTHRVTVPSREESVLDLILSREPE